MTTLNVQQRNPPTGSLSRKMSGRAKTRLRIAAVLLGRRGLQIEACGDDVWLRVLRAIESLDSAQRERLRERVDWVEAYERADADLKRR
jgi:hypothetical protein